MTDKYRWYQIVGKDGEILILAGDGTTYWVTPSEWKQPKLMQSELLRENKYEAYFNYPVAQHLLYEVKSHQSERKAQLTSGYDYMRAIGVLIILFLCILGVKVLLNLCGIDLSPAPSSPEDL